MSKYRFVLLCNCIVFLSVIFSAGINSIFAVSSVTETFILSPEENSFNAYIVVPEQATEIERFAAGELAKYIGKITGAEILVVKEKPDLQYFGFYIGHTIRGGMYAPPQKLSYDGSNGFRIKSIPNGLVIVGGDDLSTIYGVYAFLEEYQGCAWILPTELGEVVLRNKGIIVPENIDVTQVPDFPIRWMDQGDWPLKNRMNTDVTINGHDVGVINKWNYHTYQTLVPDENYLEDHPEYFSLVDTKRIGGGREGRGQICTSNPEVILLVTQHLINELKRNPAINFISLTPNDWFGFCQCTHCKAQVVPEWVNNRQGVATGPVHTFNNQVARRVKKYCPNQYIKVGAYMGYLRYPLDPTYKPEDNLAFMFTPHIHYCHNHAITDQSCPYIKDFMNEYYKWAANTKHLQIFAYECLHGWANLIWPMVHILKKDMPEFHRTGVEQFFTQTMSLTQSYALNYYVAFKLSWNSSLDVNNLIKDFSKKSYGDAGPVMERYHKFIEDAWENNPNHVAYWTVPVPVSLKQFFTPEVMGTADQLLQEAEAVRTDSLSQKRIHLVRIDFDYLRLVLNYIDAISEPFKGINLGDQTAVEKASKQAVSIGNVLAATIVKYYKENLPEVLQTGWPWTGLESLLRSHLRPENLPGGPQKK